MVQLSSSSSRQQQQQRSASNNNNNNLHLILHLLPLLIIVVFVLYIFGFVLSLWSLPDINAPNFHHNTQSNNTPPVEENNKGGNIIVGDAADGSMIPIARWPPISVMKNYKNEDNYNDNDNFEIIIHPANAKVKMTVPKFWMNNSVMGHDGPLMSRNIAESIGSYDTTTTNNNKRKGSPESRTIYVSIASYRDFQCRETVDSLYTRAKYPERIRVGIVDQVEKGTDVACNEPKNSCEEQPDQALCKWKDRVDVYTMEPKLAVGPVFARHICHRLYRGEYYILQIDAHITFVQDWDVDIINQFDSTHNEMTIISGHPSDIKNSIDPNTGKSIRRGRAVMCNTKYDKSHQGQYLLHLSQPERVPKVIVGTPQLDVYFAAGFSFARGHLVLNVPYDIYQPMVFQGEESNIAIRAWTYGYDLYAPERGICFHTYATGDNKKTRDKVPKYWEHSNMYAGAGKKGMTRLLGIIGMAPEIDPSLWNHNEEERYGLGNVRPVSKFYDTFGIDVINKKLEENLCSFVVSGQMHNMFTKYLRNDGMGIDYNQIDYKFKSDSVPKFSLTGK